MKVDVDFAQGEFESQEDELIRRCTRIGGLTYSATVLFNEIANEAKALQSFPESAVPLPILDTIATTMAAYELLLNLTGEKQGRFEWLNIGGGSYAICMVYFTHTTQQPRRETEMRNSLLTYEDIQAIKNAPAGSKGDTLREILGDAFEIQALNIARLEEIKAEIKSLSSEWNAEAIAELKKEAKGIRRFNRSVAASERHGFDLM